MRRILTFNCHEPYLHSLARTAEQLVVIDGLPGRPRATWDEAARPVPPNVSLVPLGLALRSREYDCVVAHNISDLLAVRDLTLPKIFVAHVNLEARIREERPDFTGQNVGDGLAFYLQQIGALAVGVSKAKLQSWRLPGLVIPPGVDLDEYGGFEGEQAVGLRVANQVLARPERFAWPLCEQALSGLPFRLIGHNPGIAGAAPAASWDELRAAYRCHRFYVHTADETLEDGYNLALLEAMATGMPVLTTPSESSPIVDGESGFVSDDPAALRERAQLLLADVELARELGQRARARARELFSMQRFVSSWQAAYELAQRAALHAA